MTTAVRKIGGLTKLAYGFGLSAEGIKNNTFNVFLLFYYQQIVGLDPVLCGIALFITMLIDAVADPIVGVWSDSFQSRLGRRLPFMYAASIPLAGCFLAVFYPPMQGTQLQKFFWLLFFAAGTRFAMSLFALPHQSLVAELTSDYDERTSLQSLRNVFGWIFGLFNALLAVTVFMPDTPEYPQGLLNPAGWPNFAIWGAALMLVATFLCTTGVRRAVLNAPPASGTVKTVSIAEFPREMWQAWRGSASYRATVIAGLLLWVGFGLTENTRTFMNTFFWNFGSHEISYLIYVIFGSSLVALLTARWLTRRFDKPKVAIGSIALFALFEPLLIVLRLLGVLPPNGDPLLLPIALTFWFFGFIGVIQAITMLGALTADVTDEHELSSGARQEALLFSANTFMQKAASGGGVLLAGLVLKLADVPQNAAPGQVSAESVMQLGLFSALSTLAFCGGAAYFFARYRLTRERHAEIVSELRRRQAAQSNRPEVAPDGAVPNVAPV